MPTYTYTCRACEHRFDAVQSIADAALSSCPECGGTLRKVFGNVGIAFKGSGFYRTDSRKAERTGEASPVSTGTGSTSTGSKSTVSTGSTGE